MDQSNEANDIIFCTIKIRGVGKLNLFILWENRAPLTSLSMLLIILGMTHDEIEYCVVSLFVEHYNCILILFLSYN